MDKNNILDIGSKSTHSSKDGNSMGGEDRGLVDISSAMRLPKNMGKERRRRKRKSKHRIELN